MPFIEKTNQKNFTFQNVNTSKCKIGNVRVQQHYLTLKFTSKYIELIKQMQRQIIQKVRCLNLVKLSLYSGMTYIAI